MARKRMLDPRFFEDVKVANLPFEGRLLFAGLWGLADREGLLEDSPLIIKARVFPFDNIDVEPLLAQMDSLGMIMRYSAEGKDCIFVKKFSKHQKPHKNEAQSELPAPPTNGAPLASQHTTNGAPLASQHTANYGECPPESESESISNSIPETESKSPTESKSSEVDPRGLSMDLAGVNGNGGGIMEAYERELLNRELEKDRRAIDRQAAIQRSSVSDDSRVNSYEEMREYLVSIGVTKGRCATLANLPWCKKGLIEDEWLHISEDDKVRDKLNVLLYRLAHWTRMQSNEIKTFLRNNPDISETWAEKYGHTAPKKS